MFRSFGNLLGRKATPAKGAGLKRDTPARPNSGQPNKQIFSKVFRWRMPDGHTTEPQSVEIVGSFTHWQPVALHRDGKMDSWHVTLNEIPGGRTHHYMLLVDGKPTYDKTCDGLATPHGMQEENFQLQTDRGPRVLMLFAQTK